jgi:hypothetical protein
MWKFKANGNVRGMPNEVTHSLLSVKAHNETNSEYYISQSSSKLLLSNVKSKPVSTTVTENETFYVHR